MMQEKNPPSPKDGNKKVRFPRPRILKLILFFSLLFIAAAVIGIYSSIIGISELVYPVKVDSAYVAAMQMNYLKNHNSKDTIPPELFLYKPEQLQLDYYTTLIQTSDQVMLKGWYYKPTSVCNGITILIIHDINESKITYLQAAREFTERGFDVCCVDMRACGESGGSYFTLGTLVSNDISIILDSLFYKPEINEIVLLGVGTGAAIAIQTVRYDQRPVAIIIQNSFIRLTDYYSRYARHKWGILGDWFFPQMKKELEKQAGFNSDSLNLQEMIRQITKPVLFIAKAKESLEVLKETHLLYQTSESEKREFLFFSESKGTESVLKQEKEYYDKISAFISTSIPKKEKKTRFKKFVLNDYPVNN